MSEAKRQELDIDERRKEILTLLSREGKVKVADLSRLFGISEVTIRNDLAALEESGLLERIHGGAVSTYRFYYNMPFNDRMKTNADEKKRIAARAASMVAEGDTLILGSGTTPLLVARELKAFRNLAIVTNSLSVAQEVGYSKNINVIMLGGDYNPHYQFTYGDDTISQLEKYKADKLILSSDGVSASGGVTTYHYQEAELYRRMIERVNKTILVSDHTKIGRASFAFIESMDRIDCLITGGTAGRDELAAIEEKGVEVFLV